MDVFDEGGVEVARVGLQPGPDLAGHVMGGLCTRTCRHWWSTGDCRRMRSTLNLVPRQREAILRVHPADLSWAKGGQRQHSAAGQRGSRLASPRRYGGRAQLLGAPNPNAILRAQHLDFREPAAGTEV